MAFLWIRQKSDGHKLDHPRLFFDEILIEMRHIDNKIPDTTLHLYGETFSTPIMMARFLT